LHAVGNPVGRPTALFYGVITVGFLDQLRIGREQTDRPVAAAGAAANGKGVTGMRERYGVIAMAEAVMCPCCGRRCEPPALKRCCKRPVRAIRPMCQRNGRCKARPH
jgi:hypothetical protein